MGKRLIQQRRGRGTSRYTAPSFNYKGKLSYNNYVKDGIVKGIISDIIHCAGHSAPLLKVKWENLKTSLVPSHIGAQIGDKIEINQKEKVDKSEIQIGNAYILKNLAEGSKIYNIELRPGDSGKLVKAGGNFATIIAHNKGKTKIVLPSKKEKFVNSDCRAFIGEIAGGGRCEKPFLKAGKKHFQMKKKNILYPKVSGVAMSAYDHPHGSSRSLRKGRPTQAPTNAPPGRKVGMIRPKHSGRNK
jgi:large subunit ribosomal protein L2